MGSRTILLIFHGYRNKSENYGNLIKIQKLCNCGWWLCCCTSWCWPWHISALIEGKVMLADKNFIIYVTRSAIIQHILNYCEYPHMKFYCPQYWQY